MTGPALCLVLADWQDRRVAWWHRTRRQVRSWYRCRGHHTDALILEPHRIFASCTTCGRRTPGWDCQLASIERTRTHAHDRR